MRFIDFFAGIGGFRLGLERAGHACVGACEIAKFPRRVYEYRFGHAPQWEDINGVTPEALPEADLWCGGFPCQDVSSAGPRTGLAGERSGLVFVLLRLAAVVRPRWIYLENVDELLVRGAGFDSLLGALDEIGYVGCWRVLDAQHFALAQHRERVFVVARDSRAPGGCPAGVLAESSCLRRSPPPRRAAWPKAPGAAAGGVRSGRGRHATFAIAPERGQGADLAAREVTVSPSLTATDGRSERGVRVIAFDPAQVTHPENRSRCEPMAPAPALTAHGRPHVATYRIPSNGANETAREHDVARTLDSNGGWGSAAGGTLVGYEVGRDPANALTTHPWDNPDGQNYAVQGGRVRRLTPRECERLQGLPDDWTLIPGAKPTPRYEAIGNSVFVTGVEWVGHRLALAEADAHLPALPRGGQRQGEDDVTKDEIDEIECEKTAEGYWVLNVKLAPEKPGLVTVYAAQAAGFAHAASRLCDMVSSGFIAEVGRRDTLMRANSMFAAGLYASIDALKALGPDAPAAEQKAEGAK